MAWRSCTTTRAREARSSWCMGTTVFVSTGSSRHDALLAAGHRVMTLDLRCHGASDTPQHGQRVARLGQDVRELLDALDLEDVTLVAHSMGVSVTLAMFSISGFGRIGRFVAIDQSPKIINEDGWPWGIHKVTWDNAYEGACLRADWGHYEREPVLPEGCSMAWSTDTLITRAPGGY